MARDPVVMLQHVPLFAGLERTELQQIAESMYERHFLACVSPSVLRADCGDEQAAFGAANYSGNLGDVTIVPPIGHLSFTYYRGRI